MPRRKKNCQFLSEQYLFWKNCDFIWKSVSFCPSMGGMVALVEQMFGILNDIALFD